MDIGKYDIPTQLQFIANELKNCNVSGRDAHRFGNAVNCLEQVADRLRCELAMKDKAEEGDSNVCN